MVGVIIRSDDYQDLYVASSLVASLVLRGDDVDVFITGRAVSAFVTGRASNVVEAMRSHGMDYVDILRQVKDMGKLRIRVCTGMLEVLGLSGSNLDPLIDGVSTFADFVMNNDDIIVT